jgi:hypothetical protein
MLPGEIASQAPSGNNPVVANCGTGTSGGGVYEDPGPHVRFSGSLMFMMSNSRASVAARSIIDPARNSPRKGIKPELGHILLRILIRFNCLQSQTFHSTSLSQSAVTDGQSFPKVR